MTSIAHQAFLQLKWQPMIQIVRYRRINFRRPRAPHYERQLVLDVCEPYYKKPDKTFQELCLKPVMFANKQKVKENPYQTLLAREILNWMNNFNCTYFFQQNPMPNQDLFKARVLFKRRGMHLRFYDKATFKEAFTIDGRYGALLQLTEGSPLRIGFSEEPNVSGVLKILKKVPELIFLCGIIDNKLLSLSELMTYTKYPNLITAQAQLLSVLNSGAQQLVQNLNHSQQALCCHLDKHAELQGTKND